MEPDVHHRPRQVDEEIALQEAAKANSFQTFRGVESSARVHQNLDMGPIRAEHFESNARPAGGNAQTLGKIAYLRRGHTGLVRLIRH